MAFSSSSARSSGSSSASVNRTLHIASLEPWMNEEYFRKDCFPDHEGQILGVKIVHQPDGNRYGFIEFTSREKAERVLETYRNTTMPSSAREFRLNWSNGKKLSQEGCYSLEVAGALPNDITPEKLQQSFKAFYPSVMDAQIHSSKAQGLFGIVRFAEEQERDLAKVEMHMQYFKGKEDGKSKFFFYRDTAAESQRAAYPSTHQEGADPVRPTIYIQNLDKNVTERFLRKKFSSYGEVTEVIIKGCALIQFADRSSLDKALLNMNNDLGLQDSCHPLALGRSNVESVLGASVEDFKDLRHEDERSLSGLRTSEEGKQDGVTLLSKTMDRSNADKALVDMKDGPQKDSSLEEGSRSSHGTFDDGFKVEEPEEVEIDEEIDLEEKRKQRRREKKKEQKKRKKERDKPLKQSNEGSEASEGHQPVISWLELCMSLWNSLWNHFFGS